MLEVVFRQLSTSRLRYDQLLLHNVFIQTFLRSQQSRSKFLHKPSRISQEVATYVLSFSCVNSPPYVQQHAHLFWHSSLQRECATVLSDYPAASAHTCGRGPNNVWLMTISPLVRVHYYAGVCGYALLVHDEPCRADCSAFSALLTRNKTYRRVPTLIRSRFC